MSNLAVEGARYGWGFAKGVGQGLWDLGVGMKDLVVAGAKLTYDEKAQEDFIRGAEALGRSSNDYAKSVAANPGRVADDARALGTKAMDAYDDAHRRAMKAGTSEAEFQGQVAGRISFELATLVLPAAKAGQAAKAAQAGKAAAASSAASKAATAAKAGGQVLAKCPTAQQVASRASRMKALLPAQVASGDTFKTLGVSKSAAQDFLRTERGQKYLRTLQSADKSAPPSRIYARAMEHVRSGSDLPRPVTASSPLVKIVPEGKGLTSYTPYFTTEAELQRIKKAGVPLSEAFGLPMNSEAASYSVYKIAPTRPTEIMSSAVAPTSELGGLVEKGGGAVQYIVPDRSAWSAGELIGTIGN